MPGSMGVGVRMRVRVGMRMLLVRMGLGMLELVRDGLVVGMGLLAVIEGVEGCGRCGQNAVRWSQDSRTEDIR